jgi:molecular chaperone GrpE
VLDNLELALRHAQADPASIIAGVAAVRDQALAVLAGFGFTRSEDLGKPFDPARHEAVQVVDAPDAEPGTVVSVLRPGYTAENGMLRPAVVAVARRPQQ